MKKDTMGVVLKGVIAITLTLCSIIFYDLRGDIKEIKETHAEKQRYFQSKIDEMPKLYLTKADHAIIQH